ncbi:hypothetical protein AVEN_213788-1 [Araneus ventricosus]|uniref:Uncharacterized protein n=1 Tax=Araneus ventricosus TaxID=182803 RepID=A0A4Y2KAU0_ARAVE|nr:hypothetical protein AVEN_213788-1 [Araneus ventricosus]
MRSHRISKRVLASLLVIVMVWGLLPHTDGGTYLLRGGLGRGQYWLLGRRPQYPSCRDSHSSIDPGCLGRSELKYSGGRGGTTSTLILFSMGYSNGCVGHKEERTSHRRGWCMDCEVHFVADHILLLRRSDHSVTWMLRRPGDHLEYENEKSL